LQQLIRTIEIRGKKVKLDIFSVGTWAVCLPHKKRSKSVSVQRFANCLPLNGLPE